MKTKSKSGYRQITNEKALCSLKTFYNTEPTILRENFKNNNEKTEFVYIGSAA